MNNTDCLCIHVSKFLLSVSQSELKLKLREENTEQSEYK